MQEERQIKGQWWLPDKENHRVSGILTIKANGEATLETIGIFDSFFHNIDNPNISNSSVYKVIYGESSKAEPISLFWCAESSSYNFECTFPLGKYHIQVVAIGKHIEAIDYKDNFNVEYKSKTLTNWALPNNITSQYVPENGTFFVHTNEKTEINIPLDNEITLKLSCYALWSGNQDGVKITQETSLTFEHKTCISLQDAYKEVFLFEQFLSFATLSHIQGTTFFIIDREIEKDPYSNCKIEVISKATDLTPDIFIGKFLFSYDSIKDSFQQIIEKWYADQKINPIRTHLIECVSHKGYFSVNDFLIVIQGLEGYYYRYTNKRGSLRETLASLFIHFKDVFDFEINENDYFKIVDTRDYYVHLLPDGKKHHVMYESNDIYKSYQQLRILLICCILEFVGFDISQIKDMLHKSGSDVLRIF